MAVISVGSGGISSAIGPIKIQTAGKDVVANGSVITADNKNLEFQLAHLRIVFEFVSNGTSQKMEAEASGTNSLTLKLFNFTSSIGIGTSVPISIGTLDNRRLLLAFTVYALNEASSKTVHYTFLLGDRV